MNTGIAIQIECSFENRRWGDVDNLAGSIMDALNGVAYKDDRQVETLLVTKRINYFYCEAEGKDIPMPAATFVRIWILGDDKENDAALRDVITQITEVEK